MKDQPFIIKPHNAPAWSASSREEVIGTLTLIAGLLALQLDGWFFSVFGGLLIGKGVIDNLQAVVFALWSIADERRDRTVKEGEDK